MVFAGIAACFLYYYIKILNVCYPGNWKEDYFMYRHHSQRCLCEETDAGHFSPSKKDLDAPSFQCLVLCHSEPLIVLDEIEKTAYILKSSSY